MKELYIFCEGRTEQGFCKQVLHPHLFPNHDGLIHTLPVGWKGHRGLKGIRSYEPLRKFIRNTLKYRRDWNVFFSTLIDLYGLPTKFPGKAARRRNAADPVPYVKALEKAFGEDIGDQRFIPHLQLHEYETLLFADPDAFAYSFDNCAKAIEAMKVIARSVPTIEHIDDGKTTAPSKRIIDVLPAYEGRKASAGPDIVELIGMPALRRHCAHFNAWLITLEKLPWAAGPAPGHV